MGRTLLVVALLLTLVAACRSEGPPGVAPPSAEEQRQWVYRRVEAVADLYSITPEGRRALHSLDVRQRPEEPLFFGSYGFRGWTGLGEALPQAAMHELGHSYWGAFPVAGRPELSFDETTGQQKPSPGLAQFRRDLRTFMLQPPDRFEPLRDRLRNFPNLCVGDYSSLDHTGEADMASLTGGDLTLVPPVLRKYYDRFLEPGPFKDWDGRLRWWAGLSSQDRSIAGTYLYDAHYPLMTWYEGVRPLEGAAVTPAARSLVQQEERQRLRDFALQFPLAAQRGINNVLEWQRYVSEKPALFSRYPDAFRGLPGAEAQQMERNLAQLQEARRLSGDARVKATARVLRNSGGALLWLVLSPEELVELQKAAVRPRPWGQYPPLDKAMEHLATSMEEAQGVVEAARKDRRLGAARLKASLGVFQGPLKADLDLFSRMLLEWDEKAMGEALGEADDDTLNALLDGYPAAAYFLASPGRILDGVGLGEAASVRALAPALSRLVDRTSGNYAIDLPVLKEASRRVVAMGRREPAQVMEALASIHYPLAWLLAHKSGPMVEMLGMDIDAAAGLVAAQDGCYASPGAAVHRLAYYDAPLAARTALRLWEKGQQDLVVDALAHFAFDSYWLERLPGSPRSPQALARLADGLAASRGWAWVRERFLDAASRYAATAEAGEYDACFLTAFAGTLQTAARASGSPAAAESMASLAAELRRGAPAGGLCTGL